jgi:hypothetical protein
MADKKISQLTAATLPLAGTEVLPLVQTSTKKVAVADLIAGVTVSSGFSTTITGGGTVYVGSTNSFGDLALLKNAAGTTKIGVSNDDGTASSGATFSSYYGGTEIAAFGHYWNGGEFINRIKYFGKQEFAEGTTVRVRIEQTSGDLTAVTGNLVLGTAGKGITTGGATALGLGVNGAVDAVTIDASNRLLVGTTASAGNAKFEVVETRRLSATQGGSGWLELTDSADVTSGVLTDIATATLVNANSCYFRLEVLAAHTDVDGGYSEAVSIREGLISNYGGTPQVLNSTEIRNLSGSVNAAVIDTAVSTAAATGASGMNSTIIFRATVTMSGINAGGTTPRLSYRLSLLNIGASTVTAASNI